MSIYNERCTKLAEARKKLNEISLDLQFAFGVTVSLDAGTKIKAAWDALSDLRKRLEAIEERDL